MGRRRDPRLPPYGRLRPAAAPRTRPHRPRGRRRAPVPGPLRAPAHVTVVEQRLPPLSVAETGELAAGLLGARAVPEEFAERLQRGTGGLPYMVEEVLRRRPGRTDEGGDGGGAAGSAPGAEAEEAEEVAGGEPGRPAQGSEPGRPAREASPASLLGEASPASRLGEATRAVRYEEVNPAARLGKATRPHGRGRRTRLRAPRRSAGTAPARLRAPDRGRAAEPPSPGRAPGGRRGGGPARPRARGPAVRRRRAGRTGDPPRPHRGAPPRRPPGGGRPLRLPLRPRAPGRPRGDPEPERPVLHLRAARALARQPGPVPLAAMAGHYRHAGRRTEAARCLEAAADRAAGGGDAGTAAAHYLDALRDGPSPAARDRIALKLARVALNARPGPQVPAALRQVLDRHSLDPARPVRSGCCWACCCATSRAPARRRWRR